MAGTFDGIYKNKYLNYIFLEVILLNFFKIIYEKCHAYIACENKDQDDLL